MAVISPIWQNPAPVSRPCGSESVQLSKTSSMSQNLQSMPDKNLYNLCKTHGERARIWRQRFAGLLPEVFKRKLYEKKGFISIFEFSKKLAGLSEEQVRLVLNLEKRFETMPALKTLLTSGKVSVNKLSRIVSIATHKNEMFLATQVQVLSKNAVETLVRDEKFATGNYGKNETKNMNFANRNSDRIDENSISNPANFSTANGSQKPLFAPKSLPGQMCFDTKNEKSNEQNYPKIIFGNEKITDKKTEFETLEISPEVRKKLLELQQKGLDINAIILESLQKREQEIAQRKAEIGGNLARKSEKMAQKKSPSRHIPISIKRILYAEHGTKCSAPNCQKPSEQIHHIQRFSALPGHNPHSLAPLCKAHHELMHCGDLDYLEIRKKSMLKSHEHLTGESFTANPPTPKEIP